MDKTKSNKSDKEKNNIQVFVRVRPSNHSERLSKPVVSCNGGREINVKERTNEKQPKTFTFDKVFGPDSKQLDIYKIVVHPLIDEVLAGYNCTVFAYGQTGTGKTFTMEGEKTANSTISWEDDPQLGIIPRSLSHLFDELRLLQVEHTVRVSFLELYNEELFDLLSPNDDSTKLRLFEDSARKGSLIIQGLEEVPVHNKNEVYKIMEKGSLKRTTASTLMNAQSSRSHTVFSITVHIRENSVEGEELLRTGKLNLVDLAGSENIGRSGAQERRAREAGNINQSLLTLGRCITSLVEHCPHIPYRESKLTRLLQESLGGRTKTSIIATVSPALSNLEETLSTLEYAHRAKNITNKPEINQKLSKRALLKEYTEEIERLRKDLEAARERNGVYIAQENYTVMIERLEQQEEEIMNKISALKALNQEMEKKEELLNSLNMKLDKAREVLIKTEAEKEEKIYIIEKHMETENKLRQQAMELKSVADMSTRDTNKLHQKLDSKKQIDEMNSVVTAMFLKKFENRNVELTCKLTDLQRQLIFFTKEKQSIGIHSDSMSDCLVKTRDAISAIYDTLNDFDNFSSSSQQQDLMYQSTLDENQAKMESLTKDGHRIFTSISEVVKNNLNELWSHMVAFEMYQGEVKKNLDQSVSSMDQFINRFSDVTTDLTSVSEDLRLIADNLNLKFDEIKKLESQVYNDKIKREKEMRIHTEKLSEWLSIGTTMLEERREWERSISDERRNTLVAHLAEAADDVRLIDSADGKLRALNDEYGTGNDGLAAHKERLRSLVDEHYNRSLDEIAKGKVMNKVVVDQLNEFNEQQATSLTSFKDWFQNHHLEKSETLRKQQREISKIIDESKNLLRNRIKPAEDNVRQLIDEVQNFKSNQNNCFDEQHELMNHQLQNLEITAAEQANIVNKFVNTELKKEVSTGDTPQKREWQYPKQLTMMSPYEKLIQRFRREKPLSELMFPDFELDVEETLCKEGDDAKLSDGNGDSPPSTSSDISVMSNGSLNDTSTLTNGCVSRGNSSLTSENGNRRRNIAVIKKSSR